MNIIQIKRTKASTTSVDNLTLKPGELGYDTANKQLYIGGENNTKEKITNEVGPELILSGDTNKLALQYSTIQPLMYWTRRENGNLSLFLGE